ncbi:MAG: HAD-IB family hydrolase [Proteobacteria bacterium]|nr:HAD-IB family hydrolase [Pseudomonadota bacterium]
MSSALKSATQYAFFDVDETLISIKSMFDFFSFWSERQGMPSLKEHFDYSFSCARSNGQSREQLNHLYYSFFKNALLQDLQEAGLNWFEQRFNKQQPPYINTVVEQLKAHQAAGVVPVLVSGSMLPLLQPLADQLNVKHCLCTQLLVDQQGRLTGSIGHPQTIGKGKADALKSFLYKHRALAENCYAYGDDISDVAMLEAVGVAVAIGGSSELTALAAARGWSHLAT